MLKGKLWCHWKHHIRIAARQHHWRGQQLFVRSLSLFHQNENALITLRFGKGCSCQGWGRTLAQSPDTVSLSPSLMLSLLGPTAFPTKGAALQEQKSSFFLYEHSLEFTPLAKCGGTHLWRNRDMVPTLVLMCKPKDSASVFRNQT